MLNDVSYEYQVLFGLKHNYAEILSTRCQRQSHCGLNSVKTPAPKGTLVPRHESLDPSEQPPS